MLLDDSTNYRCCVSKYVKCIPDSKRWNYIKKAMFLHDETKFNESLKQTFASLVKMKDSMGYI